MNLFRLLEPFLKLLFCPLLQVIRMLAEELGFEPRRRANDLPVFKTGPFNRLGIPPWWTL